MVTPSALADTPGSVGSWNTTTALPQGLMEAASTTYNGYAYVLGGNNVNTGNQDTVYYATLNGDGSVGSWNTTTALPAPLFDASAVAYNGYIYLIGGYHNGYFDTVYYATLNGDGSVGSWNTTTALPQAIVRTKSVVYGGYVYVAGGDNGGSLDTVYYAKLNADGSVGSWTTSPNSLPQTVEGAGVIAYGGYMYVMGGVNVGTSYLDTVYYAKLNADGSVGSWTTSPNSLPHVAADAAVVTYNGFVYVIGGYGNGFLSSTYYTDLNADGSVGSWTTSPNSLPQTIEMATSVANDGYVYVMSGYNTLSSINTVYYAQISSVSSTAVSNGAGSGTVAISTPSSTNITCSSGVTESSLATQDTSYSYPLGLVNLCFATNFTNNQISLTFVTSLAPSQVVARDYNSSTESYMNIPGAVITETTYNGQPALQLTYTITDNGLLDSNPTIGLITDPVGLAVVGASSSNGSSVKPPDTGFGAATTTSPWIMFGICSSAALSLIMIGTRLRKLSGNN